MRNFMLGIGVGLLLGGLSVLSAMLDDDHVVVKLQGDGYAEPGDSFGGVTSHGLRWMATNDSRHPIKYAHLGSTDDGYSGVVFIEEWDR